MRAYIFDFIRETIMKFSFFPAILCTFFCFFLSAMAQEKDDSAKLDLRLNKRGAAQEIKMLRSLLQVHSGPDDERSLGDIAGFEVTVKYGSVMFKRKWGGDWGVEFTTLLPDLHLGGPGNRRGIVLY